MSDPIQDLSHDHADINRRVIAISSAIRALDRDGGNGLARALVGRLGELRELLFTHFALEEEGLFPFAAEVVPALSAQILEMSVAHDAICGALARVCHLAESSADIGTITQVYSRFETAYASHSESEAALLLQLGRMLDPGQRDRLAVLVRGL
jgi:iron-sulfur cluster repair protein YtfE (RIC family)